MGENPIKEKIRLKESDGDSYSLELKPDGTARVSYINKSNVEETEATYKYSYDSKNKTIAMILEKYYYEDFIGEELQLLTYGELCSKTDETYAVENLRQSAKKNYEKNKDEDWFKEEYPDCDTYEKFEETVVKEQGFGSLAEYAEYYKKEYKKYYKVCFGAKITYVYEIENSKMTLTEKFTGVKNLLNSRCRFSGGSNYASIRCSSASIDYYNDGSYSYYNGRNVDTNNKTISFESEDKDKDGNKETVNATYEENISNETVTIKFKDKEYVCNFEGEKYTQVE